MPKLETLTLRVTNPGAQRQFYRDVMGMQELEDGRLRYSDEEAAMAFVPVEKAYEPQKSNLYWKIAIAVPYLDLACEQLAVKGVAVTEPHQFRDVGYLAHTSDPEEFSIELIEHWFEGERPDASYDETLLGGGPHFNLITLRTSDIDAVQPEIFAWGMKPLSVQPVEPYGFTLYF
ncbi:MAG: VOC family protein, partial [Pseudomonadota bacterium]